MQGDLRIDDATTAELAARRHLEAQFAGKLANVKFVKIWLHPGGQMSVWEVEGFITLKKPFLRKEQRRFRFQIDSASGDIIGFEQ
jgi:hypothetical protein